MNSVRNLVFSSVGDTNNVHTWLDDHAQRQFDIALYYFGDGDGPAGLADLMVHRKGFKYENFYHFLQSGGVSDYDNVWVVDDDIIMDTASINLMFKIFTQFDLALAQPAFDPGCRRPHKITYQNQEYILRYSNFVENGVALFSGEILDQVKSTFSNASTGFGLDFIWPHLLGFPDRRIGIIDSVSCLHPDDQPSSLDQVVPRQLHKRHGMRLLIEYGLLNSAVDINSERFIWPFQPRILSGIEKTQR